MTARPLGVQISHMLKDRCVDVIFGIPGVHNQELYRGIEEAGITHVLARHEQGAGFMADGYARATGRPGVAYVITGPGVTNILTPLGQAYSDSVPVLVIASCLDETAATRGQLHQMKDQRAAGETVCDWSEEARTPEAAYALIDRALMEFQTGRSRPKVINVPISLLEGLAPAAPVRPGAYETATLPTTAFDARGIAERLAEAQRPLVVLGGGLASNSDRTGRPVEVYVRDFLKRSGAGCFMTYAGRGLAAPDWPGNFGSSLARPGSADVFAQADLVIALGTSLDEVDLWRDHLGHECHMIRVDIDPEVLADRHRADETLLMDAEGFLFQMNGVLPEETPCKWPRSEVKARREIWRNEIEAARPGVMPVAYALQSCLPKGTMIYSDMTQFAYVAKEIWDMEWSGHWHHPFGFGTLGYALPAAIGGAVARRDRPTLAIAGDYGFQYTVQELGTAVELGLPLPILLWDNGKLGEIEASMTNAQIPPTAVIARNPDFLKLAEAYGAAAVQPRTLGEMRNMVRAAFEADGPTLIRVTPDVLEGATGGAQL